MLVLVYGAFLALVGITATAQAVMVSAHFSAATLNDVVGSDAATTRAFVNANLRATDLSGGLPAADRVAALERAFASLTSTGEILRVELRRPDGTVVAASVPGLSGAAAGGEAAFLDAAAGTPRAAILGTRSSWFESMRSWFSSALTACQADGNW